MANIENSFDIPKKGFTIPESAMVYDIAGSIGYILDIEQPQVWIACPIRFIFEK